MKVPPWCPKCATPLTVDFVNGGEFLPCPKCESLLRLEIFPAYFREIAQGQAGEALVIDTEASCFYHPQKRAAVVCAGCGRFLCALCDVELNNGHYCPQCLEGAKEKGKIEGIQNKRVMYDTLALQLAMIPFIPVIWFVFPITAPLAIYYAVKHWKAPSSVVRGTSKWRQVTAIVLASLQLVGLTVFVGFLLTR